MRKIKAFFRGFIALFFFALFAAGALVISPLMHILRTPRLCQKIVRALWIPLVAMFRASGIIGVECEGLSKSLRGCVIAANHPSLIDVVIIIALVPHTLFVAKPALLSNPFMAAIVRHTSLPASSCLPEAVAPYLNDGWNLLVFPEGTRSPEEGGMHPFHRGIAQLILRTGAPLACLGITMSQRILGKHQRAWNVGSERIIFSLKCDTPTRHSAEGAKALRPRAIALTEEIRRRIEALIQG